MAQPSDPGASKAGGCVLVVFGIPFAAFGLLFASQGILALFGRNFIDIRGNPIGIAAFGLVFAAVGGGVMWAGLNAGRWKARRRPGKASAGGDWRSSKLFPDYGTRAAGGRFALVPEGTRLGQFAGLLLFSVVWCGITSVLGYKTISESSGAFRIVPVLFFCVFGLVGLLVAGATVHMFLKLVLVGETRIEISQAPLAPGGKARIALKQKGDFAISSLSLDLVCQEVVRYTVGTSTHTLKEDVHVEHLAALSGVRAGERPLAECEIAIPPGAMHSFRSAHNEVHWGFRVKMEIPGRPDVEEFFRVRVVPEWKEPAR